MKKSSKSSSKNTKESDRKVSKAAKSDNSSEKSRGSASPASRPAWSGSISFGLVNIPIKLFYGIRQKDVRFHLLHEKDKSRVQEKLFCPADDKEISRQDTVKGYDLGGGERVVVTQEEIDALAPKASRTIELLNVVDIREIDPMYYDKPYYVVPEERAAKAYSLLLEALRTSKRGAIIKFVMRNKEYIGVLRPVKNLLCLETMHFADEVVAVDKLPYEASSVSVKDAEVKMALQLLESLASEFKPETLHDDYREALLKLIQKKAEGQEIVKQPETEEEEEPEVIDLMAALKKSVAEVQRQKGHKVA